MLIKYLSLLFLINTVTSQCRSGRCRRPSRVNFQTSSNSSRRSSSSSRFRFSSGSQGLCSGNCGRSRKRFGCDTRIIGGKEACENEFPWAALLKIDGIKRCGGNLINDRQMQLILHYYAVLNTSLIYRYILTAGHCLENSDPKKVTIRIILGI